jgi:hypothetical protein
MTTLKYYITLNGDAAALAEYELSRTVLVISSCASLIANISYRVGTAFNRVAIAAPRMIAPKRSAIPVLVTWNGDVRSNGPAETDSTAKPTANSLRALIPRRSPNSSIIFAKWTDLRLLCS